MPRPEDLPDDIRAIASLNAMDLPDTGFKTEVQRLASSLDNLLTTLPPKKNSSVGLQLGVAPPKEFPSPGLLPMRQAAFQLRAQGTAIVCPTP